MISSQTHDSLKIPSIRIEQTITNLRSFGGKMIKPIGTVTLEAGKDRHKLKFHVISSNDCTLSGKHACEALAYVKRIYVIANESSKEHILEKYQDVFE